MFVEALPTVIRPGQRVKRLVPARQVRPVPARHFLTDRHLEPAQMTDYPLDLRAVLIPAQSLKAAPSSALRAHPARAQARCFE